MERIVAERFVSPLVEEPAAPRKVSARRLSNLQRNEDQARSSARSCHLLLLPLMVGGLALLFVSGLSVQVACL